MQTFRHSLRALTSAPTFTLIAVATLGLGIGANTAIFSVVDAILLRPLPLPHPEELISVRESTVQFPTESVSYPNYLDWRSQNSSFTDLGAYNGSGGVLTQAGPPVIINGRRVTADYFRALGVKAVLGRTFLPSDDVLGAPDVIVLSMGLFHQRFGGDKSWIGKTLTLDSKPRTIIGAMPAGYPGFGQPEFNQYWIPMGATATKDSGLQNRGSHPGISCIGRLKPGVTMEQAKVDMRGIAQRLAIQYPKEDTGHSVDVRPLLNRVVGDGTSSALWMLLAAVGFVLLIACANVANLLLARAAGRQKEQAIRAALGASRAQLIWEQLVECLYLGVGGSIVGLGLALLGMQGAQAIIPAGVPRANDLSLDWRVLLFAAALALATSLLFGLAPALHSSQARLAEMLKEGGRDSGGGVTGGRLRSALVAVEMALALVLLTGAGLLLRSLAALERVDPGFNPHHALSFEVGLPDAKYNSRDRRLAFFGQALDRMRALPGVSQVGAIMPLPFGGNDWEESFSIVGRPAPAPGQEPSADYAMIRGDYFGAIGMHLLRGRAFSETDSPTAPPAMIVDDTFAKTYWPSEDPLSKQVKMDGVNWTIVGVVAHVKNYGFDGISRVEVFIPATQWTYPLGIDDMIFVARTGGTDPLSLRTPATSVIQSMDSDQPLNDIQSMDERVAASLAQRRLTLWIMAVFAGLALALAGIGIYGVISYSVAQRSHEIGIRMALGASQGRVLSLVMRQGMTMAIVGAVLGLAATWLAGRSLAGFLFGVRASDPLTLGFVPFVLLAIAALACLVPARRATSVDPNQALRYD